jgi:hypothetical protein
MLNIYVTLLKPIENKGVMTVLVNDNTPGGK